MAIEAATQPYPFAHIKDGLQRIFDAIRPDRFFWGTDITRMPCSYRQCVTFFTEELPWLKGADQEKVMGQAAVNWLDWKRGKPSRGEDIGQHRAMRVIREIHDIAAATGLPLGDDVFLAPIQHRQPQRPIHQGCRTPRLHHLDPLRSARMGRRRRNDRSERAIAQPHQGRDEILRLRLMRGRGRGLRCNGITRRYYSSQTQ
jgi:hypothetical protein